MKVKELIENLKQLNPETEVYAGTETLDEVKEVRQFLGIAIIDLKQVSK